MNARNEDGWTPLHLAAGRGHLEVVKYLVEKGADVNARNKYGWTPLHCAIEIYGGGIAHFEIVPAGENTFELKEKKREASSGEIVRYLIKNGADVNAKDNEGYTPLYYAITLEDMESAHILIENGSNVNERTEESTLFHILVAKGNLELVKLAVERGANINARDKDGLTLLHYALAGRKTRIFKYLVKKGADIHVRDIQGLTILHYAAILGNFEVVKYLIEKKGFDPNVKSLNNETPLHRASVSCNLEIIKYLVEEKGVDVNVKNDKGSLPIHYSVLGNVFNSYLSLLSGEETSKSSCKDVVEYLIEKGNDINAKNKLGLTPLHIAVLAKNMNMVEYLVKKGAEVNVKDNMGRTPCDLTQDEELKKIMNFCK